MNKKICILILFTLSAWAQAALASDDIDEITLTEHKGKCVFQRVSFGGDIREDLYSNLPWGLTGCTVSIPKEEFEAHYSYCFVKGFKHSDIQTDFVADANYSLDNRQYVFEWTGMAEVHYGCITKKP